MSLKKIRGALLVFIVIIFAGGVVYSYLESWSFLDSIYFAIVTVTTLGYGDFSPVTNLGKIFTIFYSLSGIIIGLYIFTVLGKYLAFEFKKKSRGIRIVRGHSFDVSKLTINDVVEWIPDKKKVFEGIVRAISLDGVKIKLVKESGKMLSAKDQKVMFISSKGKDRKL